MDNAQYNDLSKLCRICLTSNSNMFPFELPLYEGKDDNDEKISILEAIELVMFQKLYVHEKCPSSVCETCKESLNTAYDLNISFHRSQQTLGELSTVSLSETKHPPQIETVESIELICGNNKFDINNLPIMEDEKGESEHIFQGFLSNIGTTVSGDDTISDSKPFMVEETVDLKIEEPEDFKIELWEIENETFSSSQETNLDLINTEEVLSGSIDKTIPLEKIRQCSHCGSDINLAVMKNKKKCICHNCDLTNSASSSSRNLQKTKRQKNPFLCDICGLTFSNKYKVRNHRQRHITTKFECEICHHKFSYQSSLKLHIKSHDNVRDQLCTICGKTFFYPVALVYHMRMHTNERNFECETCNKKFYMQSTWKRHVRIHSNDRPYLCSFCDKGFRSNGEKRRHEMIHTGEKPFKCGFCEKTFTSRYNQSIHHMTHPGPHECDYCQKTFIEVDFLQKHVKQKHKNVEKTLSIKSE